MSIVLKRKKWLLLNVAGLFVYLYFASYVWAPTGEPATAVGGADPIIWMMSAFPVLTIFSVGNIFWIFRLTKGIKKEEGLSFFLIASMVIFSWFLAFIYDGSRH